MKKKIAVFVANYTIGNSPSIINLLGSLQKDFSVVDIYLQNVGLTNTPILNERGIRVFWPMKGRRSLPARLLAQMRTYDHIIAIDPHGFVLCKKVFPHSQPIYYSLELYLKDDHYGLDYSPALMEQERCWIKDARGLIIQSEEKRDLFLKDYGLPGVFPTFILPVTHIGSATPQKSDYLRKRYNIPAQHKIALHLGGIAEWFSCIEIAQQFAQIENWTLFFQGFASKVYLKELRTALQVTAIQNVIITEEVFDDIRLVDKVVMSCDLGIAWYKDLSAGFRSAGESSSKIASYFQHGLPVIAKAYPSTLAAIQEAGCGLCVDDFCEIPSAVMAIEANYDIYSNASTQEFDRKYRFENYAAHLTDFISQM